MLTEECIEYCSHQEYRNFEIIVLPDQDQSVKNSITQVIPTGKIGPSEKRNIGIACSRGSICAFIDSDAFPPEGWLRRAMAHFHNPDVAAVGGPSLTPTTDDLRQRASGVILSSRVGAAGLSSRYRPESPHLSTDLPSCNLLVRKDVLLKVGGFNTNCYPGEDSILCSEIVYRLKMKILYDPKLFVFHHRRPLFRSHLSQIWHYGFFEGYLVGLLKRTLWDRLLHMVPLLLLVWLIAGPILAMIQPLTGVLYVITLGGYITLVAYTAIKTKEIKIAGLVFVGIPLTHLCYGVAFLKGFTYKMISALGNTRK